MTLSNWLARIRTPSDVWEIDAHCYSEAVCRSLLAAASDIQEALHNADGAWPTRTLATKIMLGVFGNVPAFDSCVVAGLRKSRLTGRFGFRALRGVGHFYDDHREVIEQHRECTLDFATGQPTQRRYTRAKVIDEIFYIEGRGNARTSDRPEGCGPDRDDRSAARRSVHRGGAEHSRTSSPIATGTAITIGRSARMSARCRLIPGRVQI